MQLSPSVERLSHPALSQVRWQERHRRHRSPRMLVQTVSPLSLPPSPVPSTDSTSSIPLATARAEVSSAASSCISSGTSSAPLAPVTSASASAGVSSAAPSVVGPSAQPAPDILPLAEDVETDPGSEPCWLPTKLITTIPAQDQQLSGSTSGCALT